MKHQTKVFIFFCICLGIFFYKTIFQGLIPFPGDLLTSEYHPWRSYSYLGYVPGSIPSKAQYFDTLRQLYPWRTFITHELQNWRLPLWNPYNFSGAPLFANGQTGVFDPLNIAYLFLPQKLAWTVTVMLQSFLTMIGMFVYLKIIKRTTLGSILGSIAFAWSLFFIVYQEYNSILHVVLWLPWSLAGIELYSAKRTRRALGVIFLSVLFAALSGHLQIFLLLFVFLFVYTFFISKNTSKRTFWHISTALVLALFSASIQLIPTLELIVHSARSSHEYSYFMSTMLIQPLHLVKFIFPDAFGNPASHSYLLSDAYASKPLYIGMLPLLAGILVSIIKKRDKVVKFWVGTVTLLLIFTIRTPLSALLYSLPLPILKNSNPTNLLFLVSFALAVLASFLPEISSTSKLTIRKILVVFICFVGLMTATLIMTKTPIRLSPTLLGVGVFGISTLLLGSLTFSIIPKRLILCIIIVFTLFDLGYYFQKYNPFVPSALIFPDAPVLTTLQTTTKNDRIWGYGTAALQANFATQYGLYSPDGYDPLYPSLYGTFLASSKDGILPMEFTNQTRSDAVISPGFGESDFPTNLARQRVLQTIGVRYILDRAENNTSEKTFDPSVFKLAQVDDWRIYENIQALPRTFLAFNTISISSAKEFESLFFAKDFDPKKTLLISDPISFTHGNEDESATATITSYEPQRVNIQTTSTSSAFLFLSDTYYPGWNAYVDGAKTPIFRAHYAFRAVPLNSGPHTVQFVYEPQSVRLGMLISIISSGLGLLLYTWKKLHE